MLAMGLQTRFAELIAAAAAKRLVLAGVLANYVLVPLVTVLLLRIFNANPMIAAGFLILAVCPGAPIGPPLTGIARGNTLLSLTLMVILAGLSAIVSPMLLIFLLSLLFANSALQVDYLSILKVLLLAQLMPLLIGLAIRQWASQLATVIAEPTDKLAKLLFILVVVAILAVQYKALALVHIRGWIGMILLMISSAVIGWFCGGKKLENRKAVALTTTTRNAAVGIVIVLSNWRGTAAVPALAVYTLLSICGSVLLALVLRRVAHTPATQE